MDGIDGCMWAAMELEEARGLLGLAWNHMLKADVLMLSSGYGIEGMEDAQEQTEGIMDILERYREALSGSVRGADDE